MIGRRPTARQALKLLTLRELASAIRRRYWLKHLPLVEPSREIPKLLHQTISSRERLSVSVSENISHLKRNNPDWQYCLYDSNDREDFICKHYGDKIKSIYLSINPEYGAARADIFRYLLLYKYGGIYIDIKSTFVDEIPLSLCRDQYIISFWKDDPDPNKNVFGRHRELSRVGGHEIQQWHLISRAGHPFLRHVIARVLSNIEIYHPFFDGVGRSGVLRTTGPIAYTLAIAPLLGKYGHTVKATADLGLEYCIPNYDGGAVTGRHYSQLTSPIVLRG